MRGRPWPEADRPEVARFLVDTVEANIRAFLRGRDHLTVRLESAASDFADFWDWIGAEGDHERAVAEWAHRHNATTDPD